MDEDEAEARDEKELKVVTSDVRLSTCGGCTAPIPAGGADGTAGGGGGFVVVVVA